MDAAETLDRIGRIVGWGSNPAPDDPEDALGEVMRVLNSYVAGSPTSQPGPIGTGAVGAIQPDELAALEARYTPEPVPPCRVCGKALAIQQAGGGRPTVWGCPEPGDMSTWNGPGASHYQESRWTQYRRGDDDVLRLINQYRTERRRPSTHEDDMKCYECVFAKAATGVEEIEIQDAYTLFSGEPICREHLAGKLSVMLKVGSNVVWERLT